jgi:hypothetical protein
VLIKPNNKLKVELKYKIYQAVSGLIKELKMEAQKLSQLLEYPQMVVSMR